MRKVLRSTAKRENCELQPSTFHEVGSMLLTLVNIWFYLGASLGPNETHNWAGGGGGGVIFSYTGITPVKVHEPENPY